MNNNKSFKVFVLQLNWSSVAAKNRSDLSNYCFFIYCNHAIVVIYCFSKTQMVMQYSLLNCCFEFSHYWHEKPLFLRRMHRGHHLLPDISRTPEYLLDSSNSIYDAKHNTWRCSLNATMLLERSNTFQVMQIGSCDRLTRLDHFQKIDDPLIRTVRFCNMLQNCAKYITHNPIK